MDIDQLGLSAGSGGAPNAGQSFTVAGTSSQPRPLPNFNADQHVSTPLNQNTNQPIWSVEHRTLVPLSAVPVFTLAIDPIVPAPSTITQSNVAEAARYLNGLGYVTQYENVFPIPAIGPALTSIIGASSSTSQAGIVSFTLGEGSAYSQDDPSTLGFPHLGPDTRRTASILEQVPGVSRPSPHTADPPPGPPDPLQQQAAASEPDSRSSQTIADQSPRRILIPPVNAPVMEPIPGQSSELHTDEAPPSPTTPTPVGRGRQRWRPRQSNTINQEIPQMLGEMRTVIGDLATSVNGLKDAVSDLQSSQNTSGGFGSAPVRSSGKGKGKGRAKTGGGFQGAAGGGQGQSASGHVGEEYVADDEGQGDDVERPKNYKLRVSFVPHVRRFWS